MYPWYEAPDAVWWVKLAIYYLSYLAWPLLVLLFFRLRRDRNRPWPARLAGILEAALLLVFIEARFVEPSLIFTRQTRIEAPFPARVVVISDLHLGLYKGPFFLERVVQRLNELDVDAVLVAGDWLYEPDRPVDALLAPLKKLKHPVYSVLGNHDEGHPGPPVAPALRQALSSLGVHLVEGKTMDLGPFVLAGLGDRFAGKDSAAFLSSLPQYKPLVILAHNPDSAMALKSGQASLVVAGHTHGGQIRLPFLYRKAIPCLHPFDRGMHPWTPVPVFVSSGLGEIGLPLRFLNLPVIDVLEIGGSTRNAH